MSWAPALGPDQEGDHRHLCFLVRRIELLAELLEASHVGLVEVGDMRNGPPVAGEIAAWQSRLRYARRLLT